MKRRLNHQGFATWEAVVAVVIVAAIAFAGYHVYSSHNASNKKGSGSVASSSTAAKSSSNGSSSTSVPAAPQINNTAGLDQALADLNQTNPSSSNASDSSQLSSQANF